jgi:hypothetical protein
MACYIAYALNGGVENYVTDRRPLEILAGLGGSTALRNLDIDVILLYPVDSFCLFRHPGNPYRVCRSPSTTHLQQFY